MEYSNDIDAAIKFCLNAIAKVRDLDELVAVLEKPTKMLGVKHLLCVSAFGFSALQDRKIMFGYMNNEWITHYIKMKYYIDDAIPLYALARKDNGEPFWWSDLLSDMDLPDIQRQIFREAFDYGLKDGLVIPIAVAVDDNDHTTEYAYCSLGGDLIKSDILENRLRLLTIAAHGAGRKIYLRMAKDSPTHLIDDVTGAAKNKDFSTLTPRQRQVLSWICEGEKPRDVADKLGISVGTVNDHIKKVKADYSFSSTGEMVKTLHRHGEFI